VLEPEGTLDGRQEREDANECVRGRRQQERGIELEAQLVGDQVDELRDFKHDGDHQDHPGRSSDQATTSGVSTLEVSPTSFCGSGRGT
jgi:hypothetical protein